ncbi:MAG: hypothetical protein EOO24_52000, partial [Comamonadaceae bacterium]
MTVSVIRLSLALALLAGAGLPAAAQQRPGPDTAAPPAQRLPETRDQRCERLLREYERSAQCYARYKTVGGVKAEAFERCGPPLKDPSVDCPRVR